MPSNTLVLGRYPKSFSKAWTSAKVSGTSPGWSGNNFFLAFFPALIFLFTLIPYIPVTDFQKKIFEIIIDILPPMTNELVEVQITDLDYMMKL